VKRLSQRRLFKERGNKCTGEGRNGDDAREKVILLVSTRLQMAKASGVEVVNLFRRMTSQESVAQTATFCRLRNHRP
jgi:hypothetical protein